MLRFLFSDYYFFNSADIYPCSQVIKSSKLKHLKQKQYDGVNKYKIYMVISAAIVVMFDFHVCW